MEQSKQLKNKRRKLNQNRGLKAVKRQLAAVNIGNRNDSYLEPQRINDFRKIPKADLLSEMRIYNRHIKARYLMGLVHPDMAVKEQIPVKLYSDVPIPTASIGFHEQYQFTTSALGTFLMAWKPNFLMTADDLASISATEYSHLTFNRAANLTGTASNSTNSFVAGSFAPNVAIQRYRLVSALLKISYNGSVLNQAGTMLACCTFDPLNVSAGNLVTPVTSLTDSNVDRFGNFSVIANGLWNTTTDITNNSEGLEFLYVPTDPLDYTFSRQGRFYGTTAGVGLTAAPQDGAHINYIVAGRNFPFSASCILVDVYYNYEVVADPTSAAFLRSSPDTVYSSKDRDDLHDAITGVVKTGSLIKPISKGNGFGDTLMQVLKLGVQYIPKILAML